MDSLCVGAVRLDAVGLSDVEGVGDRDFVGRFIGTGVSEDEGPLGEEPERLNEDVALVRVGTTRSDVALRG